MKKIFLRILCLMLFVCCFTVVPSTTVYATGVIEGDEDAGEDTQTIIENDPSDSNVLGITIGTDSESVSSALQIVIVLTVIALCPSILIMLTSFTRILVVLHFTRSALNTQSAPPNQVLIGIALFLTIFIMSPTLTTIYEEAYVPFSNEEIDQDEFFDRAIDPLREFMFDQVNEKDLNSMCEISGITDVDTRDDIPTTTLIPAFIISELKIAFWIGFLIYVPFLVIDMVVSSTLMSMGMMMLPPTTISMPFKILLFVLADGWNLIIVNLMKTFT
ncbi:MAG: flagellar type III secretion system pore protein FliP [Lachnospiraceae bacterium]|nr:flagellar type III secretion system pore protein FliP [Lachnospiraceae bacterium]